MRRLSYVVLRCADLERSREAVALLRSRGIGFTTNGTASVTVTDPDGHQIALEPEGGPGDR